MQIIWPGMSWKWTVLPKTIRKCMDMKQEAKRRSQVVISMETALGSGGSGTGKEKRPKVIEVERKFVLERDSDSKLRRQGSKLLNECSFTDVYYDTSDYRLTTNDHWLRKRNNQWQLKCPPEVRRGDTRCTQYAEYDNERTILKSLQVLLDKEPPPPSQPPAAGGLPCVTGTSTSTSTSGYSNLQGLVQKASLNEFAQYTTHRKTYVLDGFTIDLDLTDFGFQVGEIEVVVADESRITEALHQIDELAVKLGRYQSHL